MSEQTGGSKIPVSPKFMSRLDKFAVQALNSFHVEPDEYPVAARNAYALADAMEAEARKRDKRVLARIELDSLPDTHGNPPPPIVVPAFPPLPNSALVAFGYFVGEFEAYHSEFLMKMKNFLDNDPETWTEDQCLAKAYDSTVRAFGLLPVWERNSGKGPRS